MSTFIGILRFGLLVGTLGASTHALADRNENTHPDELRGPPLARPGIYNEHIDQKTFYDLVKNGKNKKAIRLAFKKGNDFFQNLFLADDKFSVGANVGNNQRFTRAPRADLRGPGEWGNHIPNRATGPNGQSCVECHTVPAVDGAGFIAANVMRDPFQTGLPGFFINRNTTHVFGLGAVQRLAEEMNEELQAIEDEACATATSAPRNVALSSKGVDFGSITVVLTQGNPNPRCNVDYSNVQGVTAPGYVVAPFQWKGIAPTLRGFNAVALHDEMGMGPSELEGFGLDGDFDGVTDETSVGDLTALTVYLAGQPRPTSKIELAEHGRIPPLPRFEIRSIRRGKRVFEQLGCASCHTPELKLDNPVFSEPSQNPNYRSAVFPVFPGILDPRIPRSSPVDHFLDPDNAIQFDLTKEIFGGFLAFEKDRDGKTKVELYSDLKRHDLGPEVAESIDEVGTGASIWLTRPLWGVGSTAPYMHDGRATTIAQAIDAHGGEAAATRELYRALSDLERENLDSFLKNLVLYRDEDCESNQFNQEGGDE